MRKLTQGPTTIAAIIALAMISSLMCIQLARGESDVTLRANKPLSTDATAAVAAFAKPRTLSHDQYPDAKDFSGEEIARILCGSFTSAYWNKTRELNPTLGISFSSKLGEQVFSIQWPACPYVLTTQRPLTVRVGKGDTKASLYRRLTGVEGSKADLIKFFQSTKSHIVGSLKEGDKVAVSHITLPTAMSIQSQSALDSALSSAVGRYLTLNEVIPLGSSATTTKVRLPIAAPDPSSALGTPYKSPSECLNPTSTAAMIDPAAVTASYQLALESILNVNLAQWQTDVIVIDNGFFGARINSSTGAPDFSPQFPRQFFYLAYPQGGMIGPVVQALGTPIYPINDPTRFASIDVTSGHGTHIAGLIFGGSAFQNHLSLFHFPTGKAWLRIIVANIGDGGADLVAGSEWGINEVLSIQSGKIINLSLVYTDDGNQHFATVIQQSVESGYNHDDLFIVAAGNESADDLQIKQFQPAGLGGFSSDNVMTVAAHRQNGDLSLFTNRGPNVVDIAAPGCELSSWLGPSASPTAVSGTSQAAAVTSFAAALLKSLANPSAMWIKRRLIISGRLLEDGVPPQKTADGTRNILASDVTSRSRLDIPVALQSMDAYVRYQLAGDASETQAIGSIVQMDDVACKNSSSRPWDDIWAIKRSEIDHKAWLFSGKTSGKPHHLALNPVCEIDEARGGKIYFHPRLLIAPDWSTSKPSQNQVPIPLNVLKMYVAQTVPSQS